MNSSSKKWSVFTVLLVFLVLLTSCTEKKPETDRSGDLQMMQTCYDVVIKEAAIDPEVQIQKFFDKIVSSPQTSSGYADYIEAHPEEYRELLYFGDYTLRYILNVFEAGGQMGLQGHLMRSLLDELAPECKLEFYPQTAQEYFDYWLQENHSFASRLLQREDEKRKEFYVAEILKTDTRFRSSSFRRPTTGYYEYLSLSPELGFAFEAVADKLQEDRFQQPAVPGFWAILTLQNGEVLEMEACQYSCLIRFRYTYGDIKETTVVFDPTLYQYLLGVAEKAGVDLHDLDKDGDYETLTYWPEKNRWRSVIRDLYKGEFLYLDICEELQVNGASHQASNASASEYFKMTFYTEKGYYYYKDGKMHPCLLSN
ncbi:MAG: hypothetical protein E7223_07880 [Clostridiales bacterium]|nr:hypothetical protein [Clostridiales bacterium]